MDAGNNSFYLSFTIANIILRAQGQYLRSMLIFPFMISYLFCESCKLDARVGERRTFLTGFRYLAQSEGDPDQYLDKPLIQLFRK